jgi:hypothetical protein
LYLIVPTQRESKNSEKSGITGDDKRFIIGHVTYEAARENLGRGSPRN